MKNLKWIVFADRTIILLGIICLPGILALLFLHIFVDVFRLLDSIGASGYGYLLAPVVTSAVIYVLALISLVTTAF